MPLVGNGCLWHMIWGMLFFIFFTGSVVLFGLTFGCCKNSRSVFLFLQGREVDSNIIRATENTNYDVSFIVCKKYPSSSSGTTLFCKGRFSLQGKALPTTNIKGKPKCFKFFKSIVFL